MYEPPQGSTTLADAGLFLQDQLRVAGYARGKV